MHFWKLQRWELYKNLSIKQSIFATAFFPHFKFFFINLLPVFQEVLFPKEYKGQAMSQVQNLPDVDMIVLHCVLLFWGAVHGIGTASRFWVRKTSSWWVRFFSSFVDILLIPYPVFRFTGHVLHLCWDPIEGFIGMNVSGLMNWIPKCIL